MARKPTLNGERSSIVTVDLNNSNMKELLFNIAKNKGMSLTDFVRSTLFKLIEETPDHMKSNRHTDY